MQEAQSIEKKVPKAVFIVIYSLFSKMLKMLVADRALRIYWLNLISNIINTSLSKISFQDHYNLCMWKCQKFKKPFKWWKHSPKLKVWICGYNRNNISRFYVELGDLRERAIKIEFIEDCSMVGCKHSCIINIWRGPETIEVKFRKCQIQFKTDLKLTRVHQRPKNNSRSKHCANLQPQSGIETISRHKESPIKKRRSRLIYCIIYPIWLSTLTWQIFYLITSFLTEHDKQTLKNNKIK